MLKHAVWAALVFSLACSTADRRPAAPSPALPAPAPAAPAPAAPAAKAPECAVMQAKTEPEGLNEEGRWLHEHYPGWKKVKQSAGPGPGGKLFDYLEIVTPTGEKHS